MCLVDMNGEPELPDIEWIKSIFGEKYSPLPEYIQLELDFLDEMFEKRIEDDRA